MVLPVQGPPQHQHIAQRALWAGRVDLRQYYYGFPEMLMPEVYPYIRPSHRLATTPFNWAGPRPCLCRKCHRGRPGLVTPAFSVALLPRTPLLHAEMGLAVRIQSPPCQVLPTISLANPITLSLLVAPPRPCHPPGIGFVCLFPGRPEWIAYHHHDFTDISLQLHPVKYYH